jgi:ribosomal protein S18 acetylase RimI-like enzyme
MNQMPDALVRDAVLADAPVIAAFNVAMALESENLKLVPEVVRAGVEAVLRDPAKGFYVVATSGGQVVGQTMVTFEWSDWRNANWWWIQSVYVSPGARRRGIFRRLYEEVQARAKRAGVHGIRLYVERENVGAQQTYRALGMAHARYEVFELGHE